MQAHTSTSSSPSMSPFSLENLMRNSSTTSSPTRQPLGFVHSVSPSPPPTPPALALAVPTARRISADHRDNPFSIESLLNGRKVEKKGLRFASSTIPPTPSASPSPTVYNVNHLLHHHPRPHSTPPLSNPATSHSTFQTSRGVSHTYRHHRRSSYSSSSSPSTASTSSHLPNRRQSNHSYVSKFIQDGLAAEKSTLVCTKCSITFQRKHDLKRHKMKCDWEYEKLIACRFCDKIFNRRDILRNHMRKNHPKESWDKEEDRNSNADTNLSQ